jgi:hypothetical protein
MMREVVAARPGSARAHYVYAEILAHDRHFDQAAREARLAREAAPDLSFTQPEKFRAFEQLLEREQRAAKSPAATRTTLMPTPHAGILDHAGSVPGWMWGLGGALIAALLWRVFSARSQAAGMGPAGAGYGAPVPTPAPPQGYGPGYGPSGGVPSAGTGMLGTGIAAAGGFAAGMLAENLLDGRRETPGSAVGGSGGVVPGVSEDAAARNDAADELEQRSIDFGSGDDWGGGSDDSSVSDDSGGDNSSDGW